MIDPEDFTGKTKEEVLEYVKQFGKDADLEGFQNSSPTMRELLAYAHYADTTYDGYIVKDIHRRDRRVTVDGITLKNITAEEAVEILQQFKSADDLTCEKQDDGTYVLYAWWD